MSTLLYTPQNMTPITYIGAVNELRDMHIPVPGKDVWGIDTLRRTLRGSIPAFLRMKENLRQGETYQGFYLQSWTPIEHLYFPGFSLDYRGLLNGIPDPYAVNDVALQMATIATDTPQKATREIQYYAPQTTWRYISNTKPNGARYGSVDVGAGSTPYILSSVIRLEDGSRLIGNAPADLVTALSVGAEDQVVAHHSERIWGTPYYEVEDVVQRIYPSSR